MCPNVEEVYPLLGAPYKFATVARGGGAALPLITAFTPLPAYCLLTASACLGIKTKGQAMLKPPMVVHQK